MRKDTRNAAAAGRRHDDRKRYLTRLMLALLALFIVLSGVGQFFGCRYIDRQLLISNQNIAVDVALLVKNNFSITDAELSYMKGLTFNEMEVDPINYRLMDVGDGVQLNADVSNVYILFPLAEAECVTLTDADAEAAEFLGYSVGDVLDGMWLLNGKIDETGKFVVAERDNIYRYTQLNEAERAMMADRQPCGSYTKDAWGEFVTGYAPIYTVEGSFAGMLGIDMDPDRYQASARQMILVLITAFAATSLVLAGLFACFYLKYTRVHESQLEFDFYSRMSHDMRTPMNGILGMAELSRDEHDPEVLRRNFEKVEASGQYMLGLINDTLDIQRIESGRLTLNPKRVHCAQVMTELTEMIAPAARQKGIDFRLVNSGMQLDCYAMLDVMRVKQIFMNLVSNAIKFTPEGGSVILELKCLGESNGVAHDCFRVTDSGVGMSADFVKNHLFQPFEQENNSMTTKYAGSGLGLAIVRSLVRQMGGSIEVESTPGKGTSFTVKLDIQLAEAPEDGAGELPEAHAAADVQTLRGRHILLCEDHPLNAEIARRLLERVGCIVLVAENGRRGVEAFSASAPGGIDAVLMDIRMPEMDGLEAARTIRALPRADARSVPIIAMTANAYAEDHRLAREAGMNAHLAKPVNAAELYETLIKTIAARRAEEE